MFNRIFSEEKIPTEWKEGIIVKLPKKGQLTDCNNWRGINLLSVPGKILSRIILDRIKDDVDKILREEQSGFRKNRSCLDNIFILRTIIEQTNEWKSSMYINFIDFEKAFDSIHRESLWQILHQYGIHRKLIEMIKEMYNGFKCAVRHEGELTDWFLITSGVRQGCILSPLLFLIAIDWLMRRVTKHQRGIQWGLMDVLEDMDFADDISLFSHTQQHMQEKSDSVVHEGKKKVNSKKTKIMKANCNNNRDIKMNEQSIEEMSDFCYLGSTLSNDGEVLKEINIRIGKATSAFNNLKKTTWKSRALSNKTKIRIYKSNVRSVLLYGAETWKCTKEIERRLRGVEGRLLRRIMKIRWTDRVSNIELAERTGISNINQEIKKRRWKYIGHVLRMEPSRHVKRALRWTPAGKRKQGRPKSTWRRTVEAEIKQHGYSWGEMERLAKDRAGWRSLVDALCAT